MIKRAQESGIPFDGPEEELNTLGRWQYSA